MSSQMSSPTHVSRHLSDPIVSGRPVAADIHMRDLIGSDCDILAPISARHLAHGSNSARRPRAICGAQRYSRAPAW